MFNHAASYLSANIMTITLPAWFPALGLIVAILALLLAALNYRRKSGLDVRGGYSLASSIDCDDKYVSSVILENLKDRSITIFAIYLRVGHAHYVELEDFGNKPFILKAFETYRQDYGVIQFYESNSTRVNLNDLYSDRKIKQRLVLSTSDGKYTVPKYLHAWNPVSDYFRNLMTMIVRARSLRHGNLYVGSNIDYVVDLTTFDGHKQTVQLSKDSWQYRVFKNFILTKESLESKAELDRFILEQMKLEKIQLQTFSIFETSIWKAEASEIFQDHFNAVPVGWFKYFVVGRIATFLDGKLTMFSRR